ncbi:hypothetical protein [Pelagicoccus sp. SDUM812003]|uniref:carboxymuconolactone decarboxylase family protein n=1 Tax=Pelagicoccus sp. SDUM812003 TaxID=3041267 RepID=UPI00280C4510|nr:hypothetical protein [Pelagicoccus sp. SDUM812003]MDQ8202199.1 hypothetical protein [Pelagicoccus sp. SDUM812003]
MFNNRAKLKSVNLDSLPVPLRLELQNLLDGKGSLKSYLEVLANSPLILEAYLVFGNALEKSSLSPELQARLSLTLGELTSSSYVVSAATSRAKALGISDEEIRRARCGESDVPPLSAALKFARQLIGRHGHLRETEFEQLKQHFHEERAIVEMVAAVAQIYFSSLLNNLAETPLDHPPAHEIRDRE